MDQALQINAYSVPGLAAASAQYGPPMERAYTYVVSKDTFLYWQTVRRKRAAEVILLLRRRNGRYLVHTKAFYPAGVYRLLSGGIKPEEELLAAVRRETYEETGLDICIARFLGILHHLFVYDAQSLPFTSYLFAVTEEGGTLHSTDPDEAISDYRELTLAEIVALADTLEALPPDWSDWGRFRASAHRLVGELVKEDRDV